MSRAVLTLEIPADAWIGAVSRNHPEAQFRVLAATTSENGGVALAEVIDDDDQRILHDIESANSVSAVEVLEKDDETLLLEIETETAMFLEFARRAGVPIKTPFSVQDGEVIWELTASRHRLSSLNEALTDAGITFTVESIYQEVDSERLLTERQWTIIQTALQEGYYDTPRTCTQEDIARNVGLAKSTCSELLHRAEEAIIKRLVGTHIERSAGKSKQESIIV